LCYSLTDISFGGDNEFMLATPELIDVAAQPHRLAEMLSRCLNEVPLYQRNGIAAPGIADFRSGDADWALETLSRLPLITKQDIRRGFPANFLGESVDLDELIDDETIELEHTSGTSEERTALLLPRGWWAEQELRALRLNPTVARLIEEHPNARRVTINSPVCSGDICYTGVPSRNDRIVGNALFVSLSRFPFLWGEADLARMAAETSEWQPQFLDVDPVYGVVFARYCERRGLRLPSLRFILCSYEFVSAAHRRIFQRAFGVPVFNFYGSTETGHLLMEDHTGVRPSWAQQAGMENGPGEVPGTARPADVAAPGDGRTPGRMLPAQETAFLETIHTDAENVSELVVTTLTNSYMPLIRYRIGDLVERHESAGEVFYTVHGRVLDAFNAPGGRRVTTWQVDQCLADLEGMAHYQLIERREGSWLFRFVPDCNGPTARTLQTIRQRLAQLLEIKGDLAIHSTDILAPETSGKFRLGYPAGASTG
jgi:phenylacetate-CoA ligase